MVLQADRDDVFKEEACGTYSSYVCSGSQLLYACSNYQSKFTTVKHGSDSGVSFNLLHTLSLRPIFQMPSALHM